MAPLSLIMMFAGLMSRCRIPAACAAASASAICTAYFRPSATDSLLRASNWASDGPGDVLHRDEVDTLVLPDVVDRDDVRMIERGGGSGLVDEALSALFADRSVVPEQLDGDGPSEAHVDRTVDDAHAAFTDRRQYLVMRQRLRRHRRDRQHETLSLVGRFASYLGSNLISALIFSRRSRIALISASSSQAPSAASS